MKALSSLVLSKILFDFSAEAGVQKTKPRTITIKSGSEIVAEEKEEMHRNSQVDKQSTELLTKKESGVIFA